LALWLFVCTVIIIIIIIIIIVAAAASVRLFQFYVFHSRELLIIYRLNVNKKITAYSISQKEQRMKDLRHIVSV
jgi:flagellar basal body-associated protein FliL